MRTIEQKRAAHALTRVKKVETQPEDFKQKYRAYSDRFGPAVLMNGLGQALATEHAAGSREPAHLELYRSVSDWLCAEGGVYPAGRDLLQSIMEEDETHYLRAQAEALAWLTWHKKFCHASLPKGAGD